MATAATISMSQDDLINKVKEERSYQDKKYGGDWNDDVWTATEWCAFIEKYKANALVSAIDGNKDEFVKQMIKVSALALAAAEAAERKGSMTK